MPERGSEPSQTDGESITVALSELASSSLAGPVAPPKLAGATVGRYLVLGELGHGGMGVVLRAYDPTLHREVALKRLHARALARGEQTRLLREAQAMAQLSHPNVVAVYDVELSDTEVVLAMEYVDGHTLRDWLEVRRERPEILRCLRDAGRGLQAAHDAGLVHRDFKPANVLVGRDGRVRVTDFGLARGGEPDSSATTNRELDSVDHSQHPLAAPLTEDGMVVGTPAYMAPEQHLGQAIDARSDQYAFCVTAWELLCGSRPFRGTMRALVEAKRRGVPPLTRELNLPGWLYAVLRRGLDPDPEARWATMLELLRALQRDPARSRRRTAVMAVTIGLLGVSAGVMSRGEPEPPPCAAGQAQLEGAWDEPRRAQVQRALLATDKPYAEQAWARVGAGLDDYAARWVTAYEDACAATHIRGEQSEHLLDLRSACLRQRRSSLVGLVDVLAEADDALVSKASEAVSLLPALDPCSDAERLLDQLAPPEDPRAAQELIAIRERATQVGTLRWAGRNDQSLALIDSLLERARGLDYSPLEAELLQLRGVSLSTLGRYEDASADLRRAYELALGSGHDHVAALAAGGLASEIGYTKASLAEGQIWASTALALARRVGSAGTTESSVLGHLGSFSLRQSEFDEAMRYFQRALEVREQQHGRTHPDVATMLSNIGIVFDQQGEYQQAEHYLREALEIERSTLGEEHPRVSTSMHNLGICLQLQGRYDAAEPVMRDAAALRARVLGSEHPLSISTGGDLGWVLIESGRAEEAVPVFEGLVQAAEAGLGPEHLWVARALEGLAGAHFELDKPSLAEPGYRRALEIRQARLGAEHPTLVYPLTGLARVAVRDQAPSRALEPLERALKVLGEKKSSRRDRAEVLTVLAEAKEGLKRPGQALAHLREALSLFEAIDGTPHQRAEVRLALARLRWDLAAGDTSEQRRARELAERARGEAAGTSASARRVLEAIDGWLEQHPAS